MRRIDLTFTALLVPLDFLALVGAAVTAYSLRFSKVFVEVRPLLQDLPFAEYLATAGAFAGTWMLIFSLAGLYRVHPRRAWEELGRIFLACTAGMMLMIATVFFRREFTTSRFLVLAFWGIAIFYVSFARLVLRTLRHELLRARIGHQRLAVIGQNHTAQTLVELYAAKPILGYTIVKTWKAWNATSRKELERLHGQDAIDGVLLAEPDLPKEQALDLIEYAENNHLTFRYLADLFAARFTNIEVSTSEGIPVIEVKRTRLEGWGRIFKRVFDVFVSSLLLVLLSPMMLVTALAIRLGSNIPVFFDTLDDGTPTTRIGEGGRPFRYFKFRSMFPGTHSLRYKELAHLDTRKGPLVKIKNDPRVTKVGRFIRKWSIDELPELWLVLIGRMSLVGPRPHLPEEVADYKPHQRRVLGIKPGITGMAQISGRSNLSFEDEVKLDTWYIENWSPALDLYILLKTPFAILEKRDSGD